MDFESEKFEEITNYTKMINNLSQEISEKATLLKNEAIKPQYLKLWNSTAISAISATIVIIITVLGYNIFKKHYYKQLSKMKPRAESS